MTSVSKVYLSSSAQMQLSQLKSANSTPLNRIDAKSSTVQKQKTVANNIGNEVDKLKTAVETLKSAKDPSAQASAIQSLVTGFNLVQTALKNQTAKDATLNSVTDLRQATSTLRTPFQSYDTLSALASMGIETTRDGLKVGTVPTDAVNVSVAALDKLFSAIDGLDNKLQSAISRFDARLSTLSKERLAVSTQVEKANARTEANFLKMYQVNQAMSQSNSSSMFSTLA